MKKLREAITNSCDYLAFGEPPAAATGKLSRVGMGQDASGEHSSLVQCDSMPPSC